MKKEAKNVNGDKQRMQAVRIMAKSVVQTDKQIAHLYGTKAQMNSVCLQIKEQQATIKMTKAMSQSTKVTALMSRLVRIPELQQTTQQMAMEMEKAGLPLVWTPTLAAMSDNTLKHARTIEYKISPYFQLNNQGFRKSLINIRLCELKPIQRAFNTNIGYGASDYFFRLT